ncbi:MAG: MlaD family protein [bacterium]
MRRGPIELYVGLFAMAGLAILIFFTVKVGSASLGKEYTVPITASFAQASGVEPRTPVKLAGVKVGEVSDIRIENNRAKLTLALKPDVAIPSDSRAEVKTLGLIGETYIQLVPGTSTQTLAKGGAIANTAEPTDIEALLGSLTGVGDNLKAITDSLRNVIAREQTETDLKEIVSNVRALTAGLKEVVDHSGGKIDSVLANLDQMTGGARDVITENREDLHQLIASFRHVSEQLDQILAANRGNVDSSLASVREATQKLDQTLASTSSIMDKIDKGQGTIGKLVNDDAIGNKVGDSLDSLGDLLGTPRRLQTSFGYRGEWLASSEEAKNYLSVKIQPRRDRFYLLEFVSNPLVRVRDVTTVEETTVEGNPPFTTGPPPYHYTTTTRKLSAKDDNLQFSAQIAQRVDDLVLRGGIIESSGGVGADYLLFDDRLSLDVDAFDFAPDDRDNFNLKLGARFQFYPNLYVLGGVDDVLNDRTKFETGRSAFLGAGFTFTDEDLKTLLLKAPIPGF